MTYYTRFNTPVCEIILVGDAQGLSHLHLNTKEGKRRFEISGNWVANSDFFAEAIDQINGYFSGKRTQFDLVLNPSGTAFQKRVWQALSQIAHGNLCTYKAVAKAIGNEKAARAVGMANSKNPIPLIVPCHRVVGANGKLTGFAHGLSIKERLIKFEQAGSAI